MLTGWFRLHMVAALALAIAAIAATASLAQQWPTHPVRFVLPFGPGSGADTGARLITDTLQQKWGQPIVIDLFPRHNEYRYYADMTRTICKGTPNHEITRMYEITRQALELAPGQIGIGSIVGLLHRAAHAGLHRFGEMLDDVSPLVHLAALNDRRGAEDLADGLAQSLAAVDEHVATLHMR